MDKGYFGELLELLPHAAIVQRKDLPPTASYEGVDKGILTTLPVRVSPKAARERPN